MIPKTFCVGATGILLIATSPAVPYIEKTRQFSGKRYALELSNPSFVIDRLVSSKYL